jgi:twitching motility two-component system response regulator PilH
LASLHGHLVIGAADGEQALRSARIEQPTVVVTDLMMPVMDGESLVLAMASDPLLSSVPVILCTAMPTRPASLQLSGFLRKPFAASRLIELIHHLVAG